MSYKELKSGTDVRGVASDKGGKPVNLTDEAVYDITSAFTTWLADLHIASLAYKYALPSLLSINVFQSGFSMP